MSQPIVEKFKHQGLEAIRYKCADGECHVDPGDWICVLEDGSASAVKSANLAAFEAEHASSSKSSTNGAGAPEGGI